MNKWIRALLYTVAFGSGFAVGYLMRKRSEVTFEEVSEDELEEEAEKYAENTSQNASKTASKASESSSGIDIEAEVDKIFKREEEASEAQTEGIGNGQKIAYFRQWKAEEAAEKYDTRTKEEPEDIVTVGENVEEGLDEDFLRGLDEDISNLPETEAATIEDWDGWIGKQDGRYEPVELYWYDRDDVLTDSHEQEVEQRDLFIGFDLGKLFEDVDADLSGDENVRIIYNHRHGMIYHITRIHGSWALKKKAEELGGIEDEEDEDIYGRYERYRGGS